MIIGTALGCSTFETIAISVVLAFFFGCSLAMAPLLRGGLALAAAIPVMEVVDNLFMVAIPGALTAGLGAVLFWGSLAASLVIAGAIAYPVNRLLIQRGRGHAVVHAYH